MNYWIMKSEPSTFGIEHLAKLPNQTGFWDGVRNYQARNFIRDNMQPGDEAFFYHSSCATPGIAGIIRILGKAYPDATQWDPSSPYYDAKSLPENPRWFGVDVQLIQRFDTLVSIQLLRSQPALENLLILRKGNRLSITPMTELEWCTIIALTKEIHIS